MKLTRLHEEFLDKARRPMSFGRLPVNTRAPELPVIPVDRWVKEDGALKKTFRFRLKKQRVDFVKQLLDYETEVGHNAVILLKEETVGLTLQTMSVGHVTELDKEYASFADELYRDVVYSTEHD